jgi:hypothetical protein
LRKYLDAKEKVKKKTYADIQQHHQLSTLSWYKRKQWLVTKGFLVAVEKPGRFTQSLDGE